MAGPLGEMFDHGAFLAFVMSVLANDTYLQAVTR